MKNHILKQASSPAEGAEHGLAGNERSNSEPSYTEDDTYKCRVVSQRRGAGVRRLLAGWAASFISGCVPNTDWKGREGHGVCVSSLPPSVFPILPVPQAPSCRKSCTSLLGSVCVAREGLQHWRSLPRWCICLMETGKRIMVPPLCSVQLGNMGLFSVSWPCFSLPWL